MHLPNRNKGEIVAMSVWLSDSHSEWERSLIRGRLFVTNQRLVFHPDWRYRALRRSGWEIELHQVDRAEVVDCKLRSLLGRRNWMAGIRIDAGEAETKTLVVRPKLAEPVAAAINAVLNVEDVGLAN